MSACILCGGDADPEVLFTKQARRFLRCPGCGLVWVDPMPTLAEQQRYYERAYREGAYVPFAEDQDVRRWIATARLDAIRDVMQGGRWLDVGCSTGEFLLACRGEPGVEAEGIDISSEAVQRARQRGLRVQAARVEDFEPEGAYDAITAFDVLEHVLDPHGFLARLAGWLRTDGALVLTLPDVSSPWARWWMGRHWFYFCPDEHLFYYSPKTISLLLARHGFSVVRLERAYKSLSLGYAATALSLFNPMLGRLARAGVGMLPAALASRPWRFYIGEMLVVARRTSPSCERG